MAGLWSTWRGTAAAIAAIAAAVRGNGSGTSRGLCWDFACCCCLPLPVPLFPSSSSLLLPRPYSARLRLKLHRDRGVEVWRHDRRLAICPDRHYQNFSSPPPFSRFGHQLHCLTAPTLPSPGSDRLKILFIIALGPIHSRSYFRPIVGRSVNTDSQDMCRLTVVPFGRKPMRLFVACVLLCFTDSESCLP
jgi:hypothetical protein